MHKAIRYAALSLAVLGAFVGGAYIGYRAGAGQLLAEEALLSTRQWIMLEVARAQGTDTAYQDALHEYLAYLRLREGQWTEMFTERVYASESLLSYTRLAALAGNRNAAQESDELLARAQSFCARAGLRTCTRESLSAFAAQLDRNNLLGSDATPGGE